MTCTRARRRFDRLLDGVLDPGQVAAVQNHVAHCRACQRELADREALDRVIGQALTPVPAPPDFVATVVARLPALRDPSPSCGAGADLPLDVALSRAAAALLAWAVTGLGGALAWFSAQAGGTREAFRFIVSAGLDRAARLAATGARLWSSDIALALREAVRAWVARPADVANVALDRLSGTLAWAESHPDTVLAAGLTALVVGLVGLWRIHVVARES